MLNINIPIQDRFDVLTRELSRSPRRATATSPRSFVSWGMPAAALLIPTVMLIVVAWISWQSTWREAARDLTRSADATAEYAARFINGYVLAAARINDILRDLSDDEIRAREASLHQVLAQLVPDLPQAEAAYVVDRSGYPLLAASLFPVPTSSPVAADRDFFIALSSADPPDAHISQIYVSRFDAKPFFAVSRRRAGTGNGLLPGSFDGIINISVDPNLLAVAFERLRAETIDTIALVRIDGRVLSTTAPPTDRQPTGPSPPFTPATAGSDQATIQEIAASDGSNGTLTAVRQITGFPVYALVSRPRSAITSAWALAIAPHLVFGVPATLALVLLSLRVRHEQDRLIGNNVGLSNALSESESRLQHAKEAGGLYAFDMEAGGTLYCDAGLVSLLGGPSGEQLTFEVLLNRIHPIDRKLVVTALTRAAARGGSFNAEFRVVQPGGRISWLLSRGEATRRCPGTAARFSGICLDITSRKEVESALEESEARLRLSQDAGGIGSWEWNLTTGKLKWSRRTFELFGFDPEMGEPNHELVAERRHPADQAKFDADFADAMVTGTLKTEYRIVRPLLGGASSTVWIATQGRKKGGVGADDQEMIGVHRDITARKLAEEQSALLAREVEHRAKNALAVVQAALRLTKANTKEEFVRIVEGRVAALARATGLLAHNSLQGAELRSLLTAELAPFLSNTKSAPRVTLIGPPVTLPLDSTQPMAMAMHELATNAVKYGALSAPEGALSIRWFVFDGRLELTWAEVGGPPVAAPTRVGFGTRVVDETTRRQLGGVLHRVWDPQGLRCEISIPLGGSAVGGSAVGGQQISPRELA